MLTIGSLFSGIGGLELGLEWAGLGPVLWQVERDEFCQRILAKHWPDVARFDDVRTVGAHNLARVDIICGGFPCQDISFAGKGAGLGGERSGLWFEFARIVGELRPRFVVVENVSALLSRGMGDVLGTLASRGYDATWTTLRAADVGAPHLRDRVFLVGHAHGERESALAVDGEASGMPRAVADATGTRAGFSKIHSGGAAERRAPGDAMQCGEGGQFWLTEPDVGRTLDGFSSWLYRTGLSEAHMLVSAYANAKKTYPDEILQTLRRNAGETGLQREAGGPLCISAEEVLLTYLRQLAAGVAEDGHPPVEGTQVTEGEMRSVRSEQESSRSSRRSEHGKQHAEEHSDALQALSRLLARHAEAAWSGYRRENAGAILAHWGSGWESGFARVADGIPARVNRLRALGNAVVPQCAEVIGWVVRELAGV